MVFPDGRAAHAVPGSASGSPTGPDSRILIQSAGDGQFVAALSRCGDSSDLSATVYRTDASKDASTAPQALQIAAQCAVTHPGGHPTASILTATYTHPKLSLLWSDGTFSVHDVENDAMSFRRQLACFNLSAAGAAAATPGAKRKNAGGDDNSGSSNCTVLSIAPGYVMLAAQAADSKIAPTGAPLAVILDTSYGCVHSAFALQDENAASTAVTAAPQFSAALSTGAAVVCVGPDLRVVLTRLPALSVAAVVSLRSKFGTSLEEKIFSLETKRELLEPVSLVADRPIWKEGLEDEESSDPEAPFLYPVDSVWDEEGMERSRRALEATALKLKTAVGSEKAYTDALNAVLEVRPSVFPSLSLYMHICF